MFLRRQPGVPEFGAGPDLSDYRAERVAEVLAHRERSWGALPLFGDASHCLSRTAATSVVFTARPPDGIPWWRTRPRIGNTTLRVFADCSIASPRNPFATFTSRRRSQLGEGSSAHGGAGLPSGDPLQHHLQRHGDPTVYERLVDAGVAEVRVSFVSHDPAEFDWIVRHPGAYQRVVGNVERLVRLRERTVGCLS